MGDHLETDVPLDREEEVHRQLESSDRLRTVDATHELLFNTRLRALNAREAESVLVGTTVADACARMRERKVGSVLVMEGDALVGIFTERDVLYKVTGSTLDPATTKIEELMTPRPTTLRGGHSLAHALSKMSVDGCRHIPILTKRGRPVGVVSVRRIVDFLVERFAQELLTLPDDPDHDIDIPRPEGG